MPNPLPNTASALAPITPHAIRDELTNMVLNDLLGPAGGPDEELDYREDRVTGRYLVGMLAPMSSPVEAEEQDKIGTDGKDDPEVGKTDASAPSGLTFYPNSIGMSFVVACDAASVLIKTEWGRYKRIKSATQLNKKSGAEANVWKRAPFVGDPIALPLKAGPFGPLKPRPDTDRSPRRCWHDAGFHTRARTTRAGAARPAWTCNCRTSRSRAATRHDTFRPPAPGASW